MIKRVKGNDTHLLSYVWYLEHKSFLFTDVYELEDAGILCQGVRQLNS